MRDTENRYTVKCKTDKIRKISEIKKPKYEKTEKVRKN